MFSARLTRIGRKDGTGGPYCAEAEHDPSVPVMPRQPHDHGHDAERGEGKNAKQAFYDLCRWCPGLPTLLGTLGLGRR